MLTPKILGIFSIFFLFFFCFLFFLVQVPKVPESTCIGCVGRRGCNQACMFIIDFKVKNIHISEETNNKLNSRNAVTVINSVVDQKKKLQEGNCSPINREDVSMLKCNKQCSVRRRRKKK